MRKTMALLLAILVFGAVAVPNGFAADGPATFAEAKALAAAENKPLLIDFFAVW